MGTGLKHRMEGLRQVISDLEEQHGSRDLVTLRNEAKALDSELASLRDKRRTLETVAREQAAARSAHLETEAKHESSWL